MSRDLEQIKSQLTKFAGAVGPATILPATVKAINDDDTVAVEFSNGAVVDDCRLKSIVKAGNKFLLIPVVDSIVQVGRIENSDEFIVLAVNEISEVVEVIGSTKYSHDNDGFLFQKGEDKLLDIFKLIIEAVQVVVVVQGNNPDRAKLQQALTKAQNLLR